MTQPPESRGVDWTGFGPDDAPIAPLDDRAFLARLRRLGERARDLLDIAELRSIRERSG